MLTAFFRTVADPGSCTAWKCSRGRCGLANPDWVELRRQVIDADGDFVQALASGHIYVADLVELVKALNAKAVIPIHTLEPQMFRDHFPNTVLLADGQRFELP